MDDGVWSGFGRLVVRLRWVLAVGWVALAAAAVVFLPGLSGSSNLLLQAALPQDAAAVQAQREIVQEFGYPALSRVVVVARDPSGLSPAAQAKALEGAALADTGRLPGDLSRIAAAVPVPNTFGAFPSSSEKGTTAVTYLYFRPDVQVDDRVRLANEYQSRYLDPPGATTGVTGPYTAEFAQGSRISGALNMVELASIIVVVVVVGLRFRSVVAPVLALTAVGVSYLCTVHLLGLLSGRGFIGSPGYLEPILVVLLVGIMTDYAVFFLSAFRSHLGDGKEPHDATVAAIAETTPLVLTAGASVAAGVATLTLARLPIVSRLGPGMAITVIVTVAVAVTGLTAAMAALGRWTLWPSRQAHEGGGEHADAGRLGQFRTRLLSAVVQRRVAAVALVLGLAALLGGAVPLRTAGLGLNLYADLPVSASTVQAERAAAAGFAPGIVAPVELVVRGQNVAAERPALATLQSRLGQVPGVAGVVGPADVPVPGEYGFALAPDGGAARYLVILGDAPYSAQGIHTVQMLQQQVPGLLDAVGLPRAQAAFTGDTVLGEEIVARASEDLMIVAGAALGLLLLVLIGFLRALVAPVVLLSLSALSVLTTLGLTDLLFGGPKGLTFYVPIAVLVLLLSFGSDYNIFLVGRIWEHARGGDVDLKTAIKRGGLGASRVIGIAGLALALTFAMLVLIPLDVFRAFAFAMAFGILLDTFLVRAVLVPASLALLGKYAAWPSRRLH